MPAAKIVNMFVLAVVPIVMNVQIGYVKNAKNVLTVQVTMSSVTIATPVVLVLKFVSAVRAAPIAQLYAMVAERLALIVNPFRCAVSVARFVRIVQKQMEYGVVIVAPVAHVQ